MSTSESPADDNVGRQTKKGLIGKMRAYSRSALNTGRSLSIEKLGLKPELDASNRACEQLFAQAGSYRKTAAQYNIFDVLIWELVFHRVFDDIDKFEKELGERGPTAMFSAVEDTERADSYRERLEAVWSRFHADITAPPQKSEGKAAFQAIRDRLDAAQRTLSPVGDFRMQKIYEGAAADLEDAARHGKAACQAIGDRSGAAHCTLNLGHVMRMRGDYEAAAIALEEAKATFQAIGDCLGAAQCTQSLGDVMRMRGDYEGAAAALEEAKASFQDIGDRLGATQCTQSLGDVMRMRGDYEGAAAALEEAKASFQAIGNRLGAAKSTQSLGDVMQMQNDYEGAAAALEEAKVSFQAIGDRLGAAQCTQSLGDVIRMQNDYEGAAAALEEAKAAFQAIGDRSGAAQCTLSLGDVIRMQNDYEGAAAALEEAKAAFQAIGDRSGAAQCTLNLGDVMRMRGDYEGATAALMEARAAFQDIGHTLGVAQCTGSLGDISAIVNGGKTRILEKSGKNDGNYVAEMERDRTGLDVAQLDALLRQEFSEPEWSVDMLHREPAVTTTGDQANRDEQIGFKHLLETEAQPVDLESKELDALMRQHFPEPDWSVEALRMAEFQANNDDKENNVRMVETEEEAAGLELEQLDALIRQEFPEPEWSVELLHVPDDEDIEETVLSETTHKRFEQSSPSKLPREPRDELPPVSPHRIAVMKTQSDGELIPRDAQPSLSPGGSGRRQTNQTRGNQHSGRNKGGRGNAGRRTGGQAGGGGGGGDDGDDDGDDGDDDGDDGDDDGDDGDDGDDRDDDRRGRGNGPDDRLHRAPESEPKPQRTLVFTSAKELGSQLYASLLYREELRRHPSGARHSGLPYRRTSFELVTSVSAGLQLRFTSAHLALAFRSGSPDGAQVEVTDFAPHEVQGDALVIENKTHAAVQANITVPHSGLTALMHKDWEKTWSTNFSSHIEGCFQTPSSITFNFRENEKTESGLKRTQEMLFELREWRGVQVRYVFRSIIRPTTVSGAIRQRLGLEKVYKTDKICWGVTKGEVLAFPIPEIPGTTQAAVEGALEQ